MSTQDPTAQKAATHSSGLTPTQKMQGARELTKEIGTAMFTSRSPDGKLASRPMVPASTENNVYSFFFNQDSGKTDDLQTDQQVNLSFLNAKTTDWVSISGKAVINTDRTAVKKHWSGALKAWFDNKGDGKHTGDENDPRVALIDVHPEEIRWFKAGGTLKFLAETAKAAVSGEAAAVGKLVIISADEIEADTKAHSK